ncbi:MAG: glycosyltransferase family 2 protein, partial [Ruminococcus sp.]|nr:glycosyltransferase family 2 protein [Ruminococcus sp.]
GSQLDGYSKFRTFGNKVFNCLFSIGARKFVYDLGSGLNIYSTKVLKDNFFHKFEDNLTFNCYMILANCYYKHKVQFFPICWSEDDQVSNVKMMSQASLTLKLLLSYMVNRKKFLNKEHRIKMINNYSYSEIYRIN